ncbi:winged helix-turn-helix domain-containing protein [Pseudoalteromonas luteoviolacea]|uniref:OmpR/PhoB-type domain-containing protein n=1 Tax=Pseudoalteromonas luteoviolacea NCIMB 1942 TaxID=1365253 RepID=A0A167CLF7_9GAMM|nr:hypothetical protein N482_08805 [Pseudoalteromonas luteoviolacea NCIMB 1942]KZW99538.1 hypothetical protein JL49_16480 [Pseudoalteromonas luteoviolacea]
MKTYICKDWKFNPDNQEILYFNGTCHHLPNRYSLLLQVLMENGGNTVTYDCLLESVWGTKYRDNSTISSVVSDLRKLIGCGSSGERLIKTVSKRGYRFVGMVESMHN